MPIDHIQPYLFTYMSSINSRRALTFLFTHSHKLGIKCYIMESKCV